jgi:hypothetical protein
LFREAKLQPRKPQFERASKESLVAQYEQGEAMNGTARAPQRVPEAIVKNGKLREQPENSKTRVYIQADTLFLQERLARAISGEKGFEVIMHADGEAKRNGSSNEREKDILVMFSSGLVLEDLHRA